MYIVKIMDIITSLELFSRGLLEGSVVDYRGSMELILLFEDLTRPSGPPGPAIGLAGV